MNRLLITGAAGFIGTNLAISLKDSYDLILVDDLSREGSKFNQETLQKLGLRINLLDISNEKELCAFLSSIDKFDFLVHLAAQTSLLESLHNPKLDFNINALGTLNLLEYLRQFNSDCVSIFMASNKVYGNLNSFNYYESDTRFMPLNNIIHFNESLPISPIGGYSISKAISDYYVIEYGKRYSMPVISLRQSAVYGNYQNPRSDQGWVSYFVKQIYSKEIVSLRGNGKQVRDILHIDDFVNLIIKLLSIEIVGGEPYNVGGGKDFSLSILELFALLKDLTGKEIDFKLGKISNEDQKYFVSDNSKISAITNWFPIIDPKAGISNLLL